MSSLTGLRVYMACSWLVQLQVQLCMQGTQLIGNHLSQDSLDCNDGVHCEIVQQIAPNMFIVKRHAANGCNSRPNGRAVRPVCVLRARHDAPHQEPGATVLLDEYRPFQPV